MRNYAPLLAAALALSQSAPEPLAALQSAPRSGSALSLSPETAVAGAVLLTATLLADQGLRTGVLEHRTGTTRTVARIGNAFGDLRHVVPLLGGGVLLGEVVGSRRLSRAALRAGEAAAIAGGLAGAVKFAVGRQRPDGGGDADEFRPFGGWHSFPSGHTAVAFAVATSLAAETRDGWTDAALYGLAGITGLARMHDDRHWLSDVFAGAILGHLSARWLARHRGHITVNRGAAGVSLSF